jgi:outer membrane lipoprotein LolB
LRLGTVLIIFFTAGCATVLSPELQLSAYASPWHGRLSLKTDLEPGQKQDFSAEFELTGNAETGDLNLYTPLGSTAAAITWSPHLASMHANGEVRYFGSLNDLLKNVVGAELPIDALFAWLSGERMWASGWRADLSQYYRGQIKANRQEPSPATELNLLLTR